MEKNSSCCCGGLPAMWWWLLTLLGLPLLFFLMTGSRQGAVESDLTTRSTAALKAAGMDWATVNLDQRGRDVLLNGMAASKQESDAALNVVQGVYGVREVQNKVEVATAKAPEPAPAAAPMQMPDAAPASPPAIASAPLKAPEFSLQAAGDKVVLQGVMSSQQEIDAALRAAEGVYGAGQVDNRLQLSEGVAPADWLNGLTDLLPALQGLENAGLTISAAGNSISGQLPSDADKSKLLGQVQQVLGEGIADQLAVNVPPVTEPVSPAAEQTAQVPAEQAPVEQTVPAPTEQVAQVPAEAEPTQEQQAVMNCQQQLNDAMTGKTILFETNKSAIKRDSLALLDSLSGIIANCKDVIAGRGIQVSGHTDSVGNDAYNQNLSTQRADAVKDYLVKKGVDSALIKSAGFGESQPIASNDTEAGRSQNRRITFDINPE